MPLLPYFRLLLAKAPLAPAFRFGTEYCVPRDVMDTLVGLLETAQQREEPKQFEKLNTMAPEAFLDLVGETMVVCAAEAR